MGRSTTSGDHRDAHRDTDGADAPHVDVGGRRFFTGKAWMYLLLAALAYVPMLLTKPGVVSDDTKTYLYLDPGRWLRTSASIWDPNVALGSVTHETVGYLFPMGSYYWLLSLAHVPVWVSQRLWLGTIIFAAGAGVLLLAESLGFAGAGGLVAALGYAFTPYVLQYSGRISVILLPYAGLPLLLDLVIRSVRSPGWRYPALVAIVVALVSGINASSVIYVALAPLLWLPFSVFVAREATGRQAWGTLLRVALLSVLVSLWWIIGLLVEGAFGVNVLRYTESVEATSSTSSAAEVVRGLGYWYFYGGDRIGLWTSAAAELTQRIGLVALTYVLPVVAFVAAAFTRWRYRLFFAVLVVVGVALSVGAYPYEHPTGFGALAKAFMMGSTLGLALRSTDRATPLIVLGLAVLAGMGITALTRKRLRLGALTAGVLAVALLAADSPVFAGRTVISQFSQPTSVPTVVRQAADYLDSVRPGTRVYALPGENFAAYRWGDTIDPVWPAVLNRPFVVREQQIQGSIPTADMLYALDAPLQQGTMDWTALAPVARLMSVGDVLVEYDLQYERYDSPRPALLQQDLAATPPGLGSPVAFGPPTVNTSQIPMDDETYYSLPTGMTPPPPLVDYPVTDTRPIVRGETTAHPLIVDGDGVGIVEAADAGLLDENPTIFYAGTLDKNPKLAASLLSEPADLVVTDSNRKQAFEWNSLNDNTGYTDTKTEQPTAFVQNDPPMDIFPGVGPDAQTTTVLGGVASVTASAYGTAATLRSEWRPANAIDGNLSTAWETEGDSGVPIGNWWQVTLQHTTTADRVNLVQPLPVANLAQYTNQWITKVTITFDGHDPVTVALGPSSRTPNGQTISFSPRTFRTMRIRIDTTNLSTPNYSPPGSSLVGLAEVRLGDVRATQTVAVPDDLLAKVGAASAKDRLTYIFTRDRVAPVPPRQDPEVSIVRQFDVPTSRMFTVTGTARISTQVPDDVVDQLVGRTASGPQSVVATSSSRMPGDLRATASATIDGDPATAWSPGLGTEAQQGSWLDYQLGHTVTFDHLDLDVVSDAEHSRPTAVTVSTSNGSHTVALPPIPVTSPAGSQTTVPVDFAPLTGDNIRVTFSGVAERTTTSYETSLQTAMPIAVAEVGIPGVSAAPLPATIPSGCRSDLLQLDGRPLWVSVSGSTSAALAGDGLSVALCGPDASGLHLGAGTHVLVAANGARTGWNLDQLVLDSAAGGAPEPPAASGLQPPAPPASTGAPSVAITSQGPTSMTVHVRGATKPFVLVLGESIDSGWAAGVVGGPSLGAPVLVDGFANGWVVDAATLAKIADHGSFDVAVRFTPQSGVDAALVISGGTVVVCVAVVAVAWWRRRRRATSSAARSTGTASVVPSTTTASASPASASPVAGPRHPVLAAPSDGRARSAHWWHVVAGGLAAGAAAWFVGGLFAGVVCALGVVAGMLLWRGRRVMLVAAAVLMAAAAAEVILHQTRYRYPPGGWPTHFDRAATLVWGAVLLLGAEAALGMVRRFRATRVMARAEPRPPDGG